MNISPPEPPRTSRLRRAVRAAIWSVLALLIAAMAGVAAVLLWPLDPAPFLRADASPQLRDHHRALLHPFLNAREQWSLPVPLDAVSPWLIEATLAAEDQRFFQHPGVDPAAALRALGQNAAAGRIASGASTITMQLVKLTRGGERTLSSKLAQAAAAIRLDARASKQDILAAYLNKAPYGLNLVGCEAGARRWFGKPARELALSEAALLAGMPRAPSRLNPLRHTEAARARRDFVLARMRQEGRITAAQCREAQAAPLGVAWHGFPAYAPHLARRLRPLAGQDGVLPTTLDGALQAAVEAALPRHLAALPAPVNNAAAIIVDVGGAEILARAGSANFFDGPSAGQVDAARARRSPGSTLKPFFYALALDAHRLYASEMLLDDALDFGLYNPANFDGEFRGLVSASEALRDSLNIPAVTILERVGTDAALAALRRLGLSSLSRPAADYGLGLALGGGEARLDELAEAYTALAAMGTHRPLRVWRGDDRDGGVVSGETAKGGGGMTGAAVGERVLTRGACLQIFSMLAHDADDAAYAPEAAPAAPRPRLCWKTGTSAGRRDAWAVVFDANYVVAVWVGNSQGRPSPALTGAGAALPLALEIFRALPPGEAPAMPDPAGGLRSVDICARSGLPAVAACPARATAWMAADQLLHRRCALHAAVASAGGESRVIERWPADARRWDLAAIVPPALSARAPDWGAGARTEFNSDAASISLARGAGSGGDPTAPALRILSPAPRGEFILTGDPQGDALRLRASTSATESLTWFLDGRHAGASSPDAPLWLPLTAGEHTLACMNAAGETARANFTVHASSP